MAEQAHHQIVIIGGGAAGITVAASLKRHADDIPLDVAIVEPSDVHYYQPAFTLVGAGAYGLSDTRRQEKSLIPSGVTWIQDAAAGIDPEAKSVTLAGGGSVTYDYLVVCPGLVLNWDAIEGLTDAVGHDGVCSNYSPDTVISTWEAIKSLKRGGSALFTQPPLPFKCPGAPQKIAYLAADYLLQRGMLADCNVHFLTHGPGMFGVPFFARELAKIADRYGIKKHFQHNLIKVDAGSKTATFKVVGGEKEGETVEMTYDLLHAVPPQAPPAFLKGNPIANDAGYVEVDANSMQSTKYPNIFGLGDACATANSKTAAAVRKQAPVVVRNLKHLIKGQEIEKAYDGYGSCPLTTGYGKVLMAEFIYGGKVTPTLPLDPRKERAVNWMIKKTGLPLMYWNYMLQGYEAFPEHDKDYKEPEEIWAA